MSERTGRAVAELVKDGLEVDLDTARENDGNVNLLEATIELVECFGLARVLSALRAAAENAHDVGQAREVADALKRFADHLDGAAREVRS